jgi:ribosomal protein S18 acetylase RimI-like enzyme
VDDSLLLARNLRGLAALHRLMGRYAGSVIELDGAVAAIVDTAPDYPWLNALVCEPRASFSRVLERIGEAADLDRLAIWACGAEQSEVAAEAGFTSLIARVPAMSMELDDWALADAIEPSEPSEPIDLVEPAEVGALSDAVYGNRARELESTLARIPARYVRACGRRDAAGVLITAAMLLDSDEDCSVQYVATRQQARRLGQAFTLLSDAIAQAQLGGCRTASLQSSEAGVGLYRRLGFRTVGHLELRRRASRREEPRSPSASAVGRAD